MLFSAVFFLISLTHDDLSQSLERVRSKSFSDLQKVQIELRPAVMKASFFATDVENVLHPWKDRVYVIEYHPKILEVPPSSLAIEAVLAHELMHLQDYSQFSWLDLASLALRYRFGEQEYRAKFERNTDRRVVAMGYRQGLLEYRQWMYQQLTPEQVSEKRILYLTPEELSEESF
jgi:hypothetical protein